MKTRLLAFLAALCLLAGCGAAPVADTPRTGQTVQVVLETSDAFTAAALAQTTTPGGTVQFTLTPNPGYTLTGTDCPAATLATQGGRVVLTVPEVLYSTVVTVTAGRSALTLRYAANDGTALVREQPTLASHLRLNTATDLFARPGYTQTGWNTAADGSGRAVGLGSRIAWQEGATLYAVWAAWSDATLFTTAPTGDGVTVTGYTGREGKIVLPAELDGAPVYGIASGAFADAPCTEVILPPGLRTIAADAFADCTALQTLTLFDSLQQVSPAAFSGCTALATLHLNAATAPVYSGSYFDTFSDKYDRLCALKGQRKLVLFSGSSTRFGYDSAALEAALPDYEVVNMGVFAYTGALPQMLLLLNAMEPGDLLLHAPEFDAAQRQFCTDTAPDEHLFAMTEGNYDSLAELDLRCLTGVFAALNSYLTTRRSLPPKSYDLCAADFDEDGNALPGGTKSYNAYGDYILYRPNAATDDPVYGLPVDYTPAGYPKAQYIDPLNAVYRAFLQKGITVYFSYAPRNAQALSPESTPEARAALDATFRRELIVPVISPLEESLYPGRYLYGTDNHLSTEGVALRTARILNDLAGQGVAVR